MNWPLDALLPLTLRGLSLLACADHSGLATHAGAVCECSGLWRRPGQSLLGLSGGPVLTLGHFNRPLFDYQALAVW